MTINLSAIIRILALTFILSVPAKALADTETDVLELSLAENIATPDIPRKAETYVRTAMDQLRRILVKNGMEAAPMRDGEVLRITVPCDRLFVTGTSRLKASAADILKPLNVVVHDPQRYKVLVAVHTDDTGDEQYADSISAARANVIDDALWQLSGQKETNVIPYGIGKDEPKGPNNSRINRAANRRVEIYIVPDEGLLEMAGVRKK